MQTDASREDTERGVMIAFNNTVPGFYFGVEQLLSPLGATIGEHQIDQGVASFTLMSGETRLKIAMPVDRSREPAISIYDESGQVLQTREPRAVMEIFSTLFDRFSTSSVKQTAVTLSPVSGEEAAVIAAFDRNAPGFYNALTRILVPLGAEIRNYEVTQDAVACRLAFGRQWAKIIMPAEPTDARSTITISSKGSLAGRMRDANGAMDIFAGLFNAMGNYYSKQPSEMPSRESRATSKASPDPVP